MDLPYIYVLFIILSEKDRLVYLYSAHYMVDVLFLLLVVNVLCLFSLVLDRQRQLKTPLNIKCGYFFLHIETRVSYLFIFLVIGEYMLRQS